MRRILSLIVLSFLLGFSLSSSNLSLAQTSEDRACPSSIANGIIDLKVDFYINLESQLESPELSSDRVFDLYSDYKAVRRNMRSLADRVPGDVNSDRQVLATRIANCQNLVRANYREMNLVFEQYLSQSTFLKRNYILIEKYDSLNAKLDTVQDNLQKFKSNISTFNSQLLCFTQSCL